MSAAALLSSLLSACTDGPAAPPVVVPSTVDVAYCTGLEPHWLAFQDGDGAWTRSLPIVQGTHTIFRQTFNSSRAAVATVAFFGGSQTLLAVRYGAPAELGFIGDTVPADCGPNVSRTLFGSVAGLGADESAAVSVSLGERVQVHPIAGADFELRGLSDGPKDILATRISPTTIGTTITRLILRRDVVLPDSGVVPVLDFAAAEAFAPAVANVTVGGMGPEGAATTSRLRSANAETFIDFFTGVATTATRPYDAIPEARLQPGELQALTVTAEHAVPGTTRSATVYFRSPIDRTVMLGAPIIAPTFSTVATAPAVRLRGWFEPQSDYDREVALSFQQGQHTLVAVTMTAAYAAATRTGYDVAIPDLSAAAGFDPAWALQPGGSLFWNATRIGGTLLPGLNAVPVDGSTQRSASASGTITP